MGLIIHNQNIINQRDNIVNKWMEEMNNCHYRNPWAAPPAISVQEKAKLSSLGRGTERLAPAAAPG